MRHLLFLMIGISTIVWVPGCGKQKSESPRTETVSAVSQSTEKSLQDDAGGEEAAEKKGGKRPVTRVASSGITNEARNKLDRPELRKAQAAYDKLVKAHHDEDPESWIAADAELHQMGKDAALVLAKGLSDSDRSTRELAAMMLAKLGPDAASAEQELTASLNDKSALVRANAASALSLLGVQADKTVPVLVDLLEEGSINIRTIAVYSLGNIGKPAAKAVPKLVELTADENTELKTAAVISLGNLEGSARDAIPSLEKLKTDDSEAVRSAATEAIVRIRTALETSTDAPETKSIATTAPSAPSNAATLKSGASVSGDEEEAAASAEIPEIETPSRPISTVVTEPTPAEPKSTGPKLTGPQLAPPN